jgi:flagellar basal body-associated protein FliL
VTALIVILVIVVIALVIIGATIAFRVRRNQHQNYKVHADEFPMPRLQAPYNRF